MQTSILLGTLVVGGAVVAIGQLASSQSLTDRSAPVTDSLASSRAQVAPIGGGPDVFVHQLYGFQNWSDATHRAYAVGTVSCNHGTAPLAWIAGTNQHPVIGQNMFRYRTTGGRGRFEQIGQSWLKHGFCALDLNDCGTCQPTGCSSLGINCSDPYDPSLNGYQPDAGPKYQVNASSGFFPWPPANPGWSGVTARRLRVLRSDVEVAFNFGARFFVEGQYIHPEDSPEDDIGRSGNNASYREVVLANDGSITAYNGLTVQKKAAIESWPVLDPQAVVNRADIEGEGSLLVGHRVWDNGNGTWDYEYAVFNMNVDRSIGSFQVPVPDDVTITNTGTHDVDYHSGEPYSGTDWPGADGAGTFTWATDSFISNPNANAIRWATLYNFRFTASAPPVDGHVSLGFFKPGVLTAVDVAAKVPAAAAPCPADVDESGEVDFGDLLALLSVWGSCPGCAADLDESGNVDFSDLLALLAAWGPC